MNDLTITAALLVSLLLILGSGVWVGLTLTGVAWIAMALFSARSGGDAMAVTVWGSSSSWTLTALPLFVWMGEILFRTRLSQEGLDHRFHIIAQGEAVGGKAETSGPSREIRIGQHGT